MAASDYTVRGTGAFATVANLSAGVGPLDDTFYVSSLKTATGDTRVIGEGVYIEGEICRLTEVAVGYFKVARGCADTIPVSHASGALMFFYENAFGADKIEYVANETIAVKVLPHTVSGPAVPIESAPPNELTFHSRFIRPYPPGLVKVGASPWYSSFVLDGTHTTAVLTWAHRNRIVQADQLIDHSVGSITPEVGQTYTLRFYDQDDVLKATVSGIDAATYTLDWATVQAAMALPQDGVVPAYALLNSSRDGFLSLFAYRFDFTIDTIPVQPYGLGYRLGQSLGGLTP